MRFVGKVSLPFTMIQSDSYLSIASGGPVHEGSLWTKRVSSFDGANGSHSAGSQLGQSSVQVPPISSTQVASVHATEASAKAGQLKGLHLILAV